MEAIQNSNDVLSKVWKNYFNYRWENRQTVGHSNCLTHILELPPDFIIKKDTNILTLIKAKIFSCRNKELKILIAL